MERKPMHKRIEDLEAEIAILKQIITDAVAKSLTPPDEE